MALSPALRELVSKAARTYAQSDKTARGIIPLPPIEVDPRGALIGEVAEMISEAVNGPAIHAWELAEMIVDAVDKHYG